MFTILELLYYLTNLSNQHFKAINRVIIYLFYTRREGIYYRNYNSPNLIIYRDVLFIDNLETRQLSYRYIAILFSGLILQKAAQQNTVTISTTKAKLLALKYVLKGIIVIKRFFNKLTLDIGEIYNIQCNN